MVIRVSTNHPSVGPMPLASWTWLHRAPMPSGMPSILSSPFPKAPTATSAIVTKRTLAAIHEADRQALMKCVLDFAMSSLYCLRSARISSSSFSLDSFSWSKALRAFLEASAALCRLSDSFDIASETATATSGSRSVVRLAVIWLLRLWATAWLEARSSWMGLCAALITSRCSFTSCDIC